MSTSIEEIQESVRAASSEHAPLSIKGRGTWTSAYKHASAARELSLWNYAGVQEYVPGNLTMTVRAGTTLKEISDVAAAENQWLPLDPLGDADGTVGATVATCSYGPLVTGFGTPRDLVLGVEAVLGTGEIVRGGGRVVKNVAGYDLSRLLTGSWGTLGPITEITLRLFAKQETETTIAIQLEDRKEKSERLIQEIRSGPFYPWAFEMIDRQLAASLGLSEAAAVLLVRIGGSSNLVSSQVKSLPGEEISGDIWQKFSTVRHSWSVRLSGLPSRLFQTWESAAQLVGAVGAGYRSATPERGMVRIFFPDAVESARLFTALGQFSASSRASGLKIVTEAMPSVSPLSSFDQNRTVTNALSAGIKRVFDPHNVMNPGFLSQ